MCKAIVFRCMIFLILVILPASILIYKVSHSHIQVPVSKNLKQDLMNLDLRAIFHPSQQSEHLKETTIFKTTTEKSLSQKNDSNPFSFDKILSSAKSKWKTNPFSQKEKQCVSSYLTALSIVQMLEGNFRKVLDRMVAGLLRHAKDISYDAILLGVGPDLGLGSTETRSLSNALYRLGLNVIDWDCAHLGHTAIRWRDTLTANAQRIHPDSEKCNELLHKFDFRYPKKEVDAVLNLPVSSYFWDLYLAYPNAKFLLTTRDSLEWGEKILKRNVAPPALQRPCGLTADMFSKEMNAKIFEAHLDFVRCLIPEERLLEVCISCGDATYQKIGHFIGKDPTKFGYNESQKITLDIHRKNFIHGNGLSPDLTTKLDGG